MEVHKDYPCHVDNYQRGRAQPVSFLVFHYVGATGGARNNAKYYHDRALKISAHYFVGHASEGAAIWQSVAEADTAWHCGAKRYRHPTCRNANSIGIEMCCHQDTAGNWYIDEGKWAAFKARLEDDMVSYKTIEDVPASYRPSVQKLMDRGALKGYDNGAIYVSEDLCRTITILDRLGLLDGR